MAKKMKKTSEEIRNEILAQLKDGPKTIAEISEAVNSNWLTVEKFMNELKTKEKVTEVITTVKMKVYGRTDDLAYYGIPFSKKIRDKSASLLFTIAEQWKKETGIAPARTILQKVAVELIDTSDKKLSDIPVFRFHYGQTLAVRYEESQISTHASLVLTHSQKEALSKIITEYNGKTTKYAKLRQYRKEGMEFYLEKEKNLLQGFSDNDSKQIGDSLLKLSTLYPIELKSSFPLFDKFIYCTTTLLNLKDPELKKEYLSKIEERFYLLWDVMTTEYFFNDAEKCILPDKKELFNQIKLNLLNPKLSNLLSIIEDLESEVNSIKLEEIQIPMDEESLEIRKIFAEGAEAE